MTNSSEDLRTQVYEVAQQMGALSTSLDDAASRFDRAAQQAESVLRGASGGVAERVVQTINGAEQAIRNAQQAVEHAASAARDYADHKV